MGSLRTGTKLLVVSNSCVTTDPSVVLHRLPVRPVTVIIVTVSSIFCVSVSYIVPPPGNLIRSERSPLWVLTPLAVGNITAWASWPHGLMASSAHAH